MTTARSIMTSAVSYLFVALFLVWFAWKTGPGQIRHVEWASLDIGRYIPTGIDAPGQDGCASLAEWPAPRPLGRGARSVARWRSGLPGVHVWDRVVPRPVQQPTIRQPIEQLFRSRFLAQLEQPR